MRKLAALFSALAFIGAGSAADASTITYNFSVDATSGPLAGHMASGSFSYSSSSITTGAFNNATGLLTALNFTWDGITYNATTANTGELGFDVFGRLAAFAFGDNCVAGSCGVVPGEEQWWVQWNGRSGAMAYSTLGSTTFGLGSATVAQATPEPVTLSLFGIGLAGAFAARRRPRRAKAA